MKKIPKCAVSLALLMSACGGDVVREPEQTSSTPLPLSSRSLLSKQYTFQVFDVPGAFRTVPTAINDLGVVTGRSKAAGASFEGFIRDRNGGLTAFTATPDSAYTLPSGINDLGVLVGTFADPAGLQHGFVRRPSGEITRVDFNFSGLVDSSLGSLNNRGDLVGGYDLGDTNTVIGVLIEGGKTTVLPDAPGAVPMQTFAYTINDSRVIAGTFVGTDGLDHGYLLRGSQFTTIDYPGATGGTDVTGMNDLGWIAGTSDDGAFVLDTNTNAISLVNCPGLSFAAANGINNLGQVIGACWNAGGPFHGFIATPQRAEE